MAIEAAQDAELAAVVVTKQDGELERMTREVMTPVMTPQVVSFEHEDTAEYDSNLLQLADLAVSLETQTPFTTKGGRVIWDVVVENHGNGIVHGVVLQIKTPRNVIDIRIESNGWACEFASALKTIICRNERLRVGKQKALRVDGLVPSQTQDGRFEIWAQVEGGLPDPILQNNRAESAVSLVNGWQITSPSGFIFTHVTQFGLLDEERHTEADYKTDRLITAVLQVPFGLGFGYHEMAPPQICLSVERPCPLENRVVGQVVLISYEIKRIIRLGESETIVFEQGGIGQEIYRSVAAVPTDCARGQCVGYGLYEADRFRWAEDDLVTIYSFTRGGRAAECTEACITISNAEPGYYRVEGAVILEVHYENWLELTQRHELPTDGNFAFIAPFIE